jgi:hypothetical protein
MTLPIHEAIACAISQQPGHQQPSVEKAEPRIDRHAQFATRLQQAVNASQVGIFVRDVMKDAK